MNFPGHTAGLPDPPAGRDAPTSTGSAPSSLLDRVDSPRAVFGLLGSAALVGLALAFGVLQGLERFGTAPPASSAKQGASTQGDPLRSEAHSAGAGALSPSVQYQEMNGRRSGSAGVPDTASPMERSELLPDSSTTSQPEPPVKLSAPYIAPIARTARSRIGLAAAPRLDPATRVELKPSVDAVPRIDAIARIDPAPRLDAAPRVDVPRNGSPPDAERRLAAVLDAAARNGDRSDEAVLEAAAEVRAADNTTPAGEVNPTLARRLNEEANRAYWVKRDLREALQLERRAFDANPRDVEIAGNLAFYYLKQSPPHAAAAREVALHALTTNSGRYRTGRLEDWMSLGIASALMGRAQEAERAFIAGAALGNNLDRTCRAALNAVATYGEAVRPAASALLRRINGQGRSNASPYCMWPPDWSLGAHYP